MLFQQHSRSSMEFDNRSRDLEISVLALIGLLYKLDLCGDLYMSQMRKYAGRFYEKEKENQAARKKTT